MYCFSILQLVKDLLKSLPALFSQSRETHSALGPALQAAFKLMSPTGGRIAVFQTQLPTLGAGKLQSREDPNQRSSSKVIIFSFICDYNEKKTTIQRKWEQEQMQDFIISSLFGVKQHPFSYFCLYLDVNSEKFGHSKPSNA